MASGSTASGAISVGGTSASIVPARQGREAVLIKNTHASQVLYLGADTNVTTSNGFPLLAGESARVKSKAAVWGIGSGATTTGRYLEEF